METFHLIKNESIYNHGHNILRIFVTIPNFRFTSLQVKRSVIISNKHGIYEFSYELPKDLRN